MKKSAENSARRFASAYADKPVLFLPAGLTYFECAATMP